MLGPWPGGVSGSNSRQPVVNFICYFWLCVNLDYIFFGRNIPGVYRAVDKMTGDEFLNIQEIFSVFLGRWIVIYMGAALAGAVAEAFIGILWRRPALTKIIRGDE